MANKEFDNVQLFAEYDSTVGSNVVNVFGNKSKENIAYSLSKIKNWFPWLVPTNGSAGQILEWYNNIPTWRANTNADTVKQTHSTDTDFHPLVLGAPHSASAWSGDDPISETTDQVYMNKGVYVKPSTSTIYATEFVGKVTHPTIPGTGADTTSSVTPLHGQGFTTVDVVTRDSNGHVTGINTKTVTLPAQYVHPTYIDETTANFYKIKITNGHISAATAIAKGDVSTFLNLLDTGSSTPTDADYYISQYVGGGTTTTSYHRRPMSALWSYVKGKADSIYAPIGHSHPLSIATDTGNSQLSMSANTKYKLTAGGSTFIFTTPPDSDTKVTSSTNHYTPATVSGQDKTASASGATAAWSIDVVKGVTLNTDGKGHVTGISVTSGKIPANPVPSNNVTGSGTSGYLTKWSGTNTITNGPQLGSSTTTFLRNDGTWATPVNSGTANCIAYYSGANAISSAAKVTYVNTNNSASTPATVAGLHIESPTYGNTAANMIGGVAGVFSYGDGGPQIRFKDASSTQAGALIFTADDAAASGTSWHFVSNETDWNVISKRFHAKTSISIGTDKPSTSYNLTVNGTSYFNNTITIKGTSSGNASINYASYGNTRNYTSIKFYDGDANGQGVQVGGGGLTVVGGGESAQTVFDNLSTLGLTASSEAAVIASDGPIYFYTNVDTGIANRKAVSINTSGYLNTYYINMATSDEDNNFSSSSAIIYSNSDKYLRRTTFSKLASLLQTETMVYDGHVIHQTDYNSAGFTRPVHRFIRDLRPNKLAFTLPANITMEYSTNAGSSWTSFGYTDAEKAGPFISRHAGGYIAIGPTSGERTTSMQTRITITNDGRDCFIDQFYIWMSTSGHGTTVDIQYTTQSAKTTWVDWRMGVGLGGWAGPNIINVSELRYGNTIYSIRFTFKITSIHADYKTQPGTIYDIQAYGGMGCWGSKNNMMTHDSLFTWDYGQNATFPANVSATKFIGPLQGNADTATTATKLGTSTVGSGSRPIYLNAGTPKQCDTPTSGAWWNGVPGVASNGVIEIGKYIDFHASNTSTNDYDYRITVESQTIYFTPKSSGDATYNLIRMQSPDYNQIQFQTSKTDKAYTSTGIVVYPLTTSGQTMLIQSDGNTAIGGGESPRTLYSNSYDNMDTDENETLYLAADSPEIHFVTNCQAYSGRKVLKVQDGQLVKSGGIWISARDNAPVYTNKPNTQDGGYYPAWFAKTKSGGWSMGVLSTQDNLYITYTTDTDYSGGTNSNTYQVQFQNKSGTVALTSDIPTADDHKVTQNNLTSGGTFPVILGGNTSAATVTDYVNKKYDTLRLGMTIGTTSTDGYGELIIGNSSASGTAGNAYGQISLYSSNTAGAVLRASSTTSWRSFYFPGDKGGTVAVTTDLAAYLPLAGGTMTGTITHPANTVAINLRADNTSTWQNTIMTQSNGDEAVVFANANARTSWMFVNGEDSIAHPENNRWQSLTPALQIKGGCVAIGKLIPSGTTPDIRLDIAGSTALTGDIMLKTTSSSSDDSGDIIWYYGNGKEKMRIWSNNTYTAKSGPNFRIYKNDETLLFNGTLSLSDHTHNYAGSASAGGPATKINTSEGTSDGARPVFYAYLGDNQQVVYHSSFTYNPTGGVLTATRFAGNADRANVLNKNSTAGATTSGVQYVSDGLTIGTADGNAKEGSNASYKLWSYPAGGTATSSTSANIQNLRLYWNTNYFRDIFTSPNNDDIYHRAVYNGSAHPWRMLLDTINIGGHVGYGYTSKIAYDPHTGRFTSTNTSNAWDQQAWSNMGYTRNVFVTFKAGQTTMHAMIGLDSNPTQDTGYTNIDFCWYLHNDGTLQIYESGTAVSVSPNTYSTNDEFRIEYDGHTVRYYHNGALRRWKPRDISGKLYFDSCFYNAGNIYDFEFGTTNVHAALTSTGYSSNSLTYRQSNDDFGGTDGRKGNSGENYYAHYIIANHGSGETYYHYTLRLPFWGGPQYQRKTGGSTETANRTKWYDFITEENYSSYALPLSGGTMTGVLTTKGGMFEDAYNGALNMNNSDIYGLNSIYTADPSDGAAEGIHFYRDTTHVDTLWMSGGSLLFVPNRELGTSTTAANSQKVARFTANPTSGQIVVTDGTTGGVKTTGYTTSSFLSSSTKYAGSDTVGGVANNSYYLGDSTTPSTYKLRYINSNDVTTWTSSSLAATDSIAVIRGSVTDAWATGHIVTFNVASVGTPFQIGVHDSSELYFYKRYKSGSTWSGWTKMNAGSADYVKVIAKNEIRFLNESGQFDYTNPYQFWFGFAWASGSISGTHLISTYIMGNCSASGSGDNIASVTAKGFVSKTTSGGAGCTMQYNSSTQSLDFIFS